MCFCALIVVFRGILHGTDTTGPWNIRSANLLLAALGAGGVSAIKLVLNNATHFVSQDGYMNHIGGLCSGEAAYPNYSS